MVRTEGHIDLSVEGDAIVCPKDDRALVSEVKVVAIWMPDVFIGKAERKKIRSLLQ